MAGAMAVPVAQGKRQSAALVFVPLAIAFLIIAGIAVFGIISPYSFKAKPPPPGTHGSLVWGDGIFSNQAQLKAWLRIHGASYDQWVKTHPAAVKLVKPLPRHRAVLAKAHKKPPVSTVRKVSAAQTSSAAPTKSGTGIWLVVALGLMLGALAATPHSLLARVGIHIHARERELRVIAIGAGAALLLGVIAATLVS